MKSAKILVYNRRIYSIKVHVLINSNKDIQCDITHKTNQNTKVQCEKLGK